MAEDFVEAMLEAPYKKGVSFVYLIYIYCTVLYGSSYHILIKVWFCNIWLNLDSVLHYSLLPHHFDQFLLIKPFI